jgi:hypothetical protein
MVESVLLVASMSIVENLFCMNQEVVRITLFMVGVNL